MKVVLVHGAWADGSSWSEVIRILQDHGHAVTAVQLPMTSLEADTETTRRAVVAAAAPVVLVGHSYGGFVISVAAAQLPVVQALVFVAAYAPEEQDTVASMSHQGADMPGGHAIRYGDDGWTHVDIHGFGSALAHDLPEATQRALAATQGPTHVACLTTPARGSAWRTLPSHYVLATEDAILDPNLQQRFAERIAAPVTKVRASHLVMMSHPEQVAHVIETAGEQYARPSL